MNFYQKIEAIAASEKPHDEKMTDVLALHEQGFPACMVLDGIRRLLKG